MSTFTLLRRAASLLALPAVLVACSDRNPAGAAQAPPLPRAPSAATLLDPDGYIRLDPQGRTIAPGGSISLSVWVVDSAGAETPPSATLLTWASSDTTVATVSTGGTVTGIANGTATITATDGLRSGSSTVTVATLDQTAPALTRLVISPRTLNAGDSVGFSVGASDAGTGVRAVQVQITSPSGSSTPFCTSYAPASGTPAAGTYACKLRVPPGAQAGTWKVALVTITDHAGRMTQLTTDDLIARAIATTMTVADATPDATAPALNGFSISPTAITAGDSATVTFTVADAGTGVATARATIYHAASNRSYSCAASAPATGTLNNGTFQCRIVTSAGAANGSWSVNSVQVTDRTGNNASFTAAGLSARGFTSSVTLSGGSNDTGKPALDTFAISPASVTRADSVTFTVGASDPGSGVALMLVEIRSPISSELLACQSAAPASGTRASGTFVCSARFGAGAPAGTWTLYDLQIVDTAGNQRSYLAGDLQGFGLSTTLTVTP
ncbi:MAG TPA: Ig-like domain-containing protein [Longimicrobium sp.]|nr:Ig-like domain-containing protein [Longimicrobium sp.]